MEPQYYRDMREVVSLNNGDILVFNNNSGLNQYFDASVLHLDASGNFVKEIVWGTPDDQDDWFDARKMPDGSVIAVGMSRLSNDFVQRVMLARFSDTGQLLWEKMFDASEFLAYSEVVPLPSGGFLILGGTYALTDRGILVARFSGNGDLLWSKEYTQPGESHYVQDGIPVGNDEIMVATYRTLDFSINSGTNLLRIGLNGEIKGQTLISNADGLAPVGIGMIGPDTLALAGMTTPIVFPATDGNLVIATLTKTGNLTGNITFGSDSQEMVADVIFGNDELIFCGLTDTTITGVARQPFISRANPRYSCCRKSFQVFQLPRQSAGSCRLSNGSQPEHGEAKYHHHQIRYTVHGKSNLPQLRGNGYSARRHVNLYGRNTSAETSGGCARHSNMEYRRKYAFHTGRYPRRLFCYH